MMRKIRGQGILDYLVLLAVVIAALLVLGRYIKNTLSGKMREGSDIIGQGETYRPWDTRIVTDSVTNE